MLVVASSNRIITYLADSVIFIDVSHVKVSSMFGTEVLYICAVSCTPDTNFQIRLCLEGNIRV